jgi:hypothetical protein
VFRVGGAPITTINKFRAGDLEEDDKGSFRSSIATVHSRLDGMIVDGFHDTQQEMKYSDEQTGQEQHTVAAFSPANISNLRQSTLEHIRPT